MKAYLLLFCTLFVGSSVFCQTGVADFSINQVEQCFKVNSFNFTNSSSDSTGYTKDSLYWEFGNGSFESTLASEITSKNVSYATSGKFTVKLIAVYKNNLDSTVKLYLTTTKEVTVYPTPLITNAETSITICSGTATSITLAPNTGNSYSWSLGTNTGGITNASASSGAIINQTLTNPSDATVGSIVYSVTPTSTVGGCVGSVVDFTITVNPKPAAPVFSLATETKCNNTTTTVVTFSSSTDAANTLYDWTNNTTSVGLDASATNVSGATGIAAFTAINSTSSPVTATISVTPKYTNNSVTCSGTPDTFTKIVNPIPATPTFSLATETKCNGTATTAVTFSSSTAAANTLYDWTNNTTSVGLGASATNVNGTTGIAAFTATNSTSSPVTATISVTPKYTNNSVTCIGSVGTFTKIVNPTPGISTFSVDASETICNAASTKAVTFSSSTAMSNTLYDWTNNTTSVGLGASATNVTGATGIAAFTATNSTSSPVTATISVTPKYTNNSITCIGLVGTFTKIVNPIPATPTFSLATETKCNATATSAVTFSSSTAISNTLYDWTNNTTSVGLGASATNVTGATGIAAFTATNSTSSPVTATISVTPKYTNNSVTCIGSVGTFTKVINPTPVITISAGASETICNTTATSNNKTATAVTFTSTTTVANTLYDWTNNAPSIGLAASATNVVGTAGIAAFTAINTTSSPVTATISVTPRYTNNSVTCDGVVGTFTKVVNPTPVITLSTGASQIKCNGIQTTPVTFSSNTASNTLYDWTNNTTSIGLGASATNVVGTTGIVAFTAINTDASNPLVSVLATVNVTPKYTNNSVTCTGIVGTFTIRVNPTPAKPTITAAPSSPLCQNTNNQNFTATTTSVPPVDGIKWGWYIGNTAPYSKPTGLVYDTTHANTGSSIISFPTAGPVTIHIEDTIYATGCINFTDTTYTVTSPASDTAKVYYYGQNLVCGLNRSLVEADKTITYKWGYDDANTLRSTTIANETQQNYYVPSLDLNNKSYWVITTRPGGTPTCYSKNYYNKPIQKGARLIGPGPIVTPVSFEKVNIFPNPVAASLTVAWQSVIEQDIVFVVADINGKKLQSKTVQKAAISGNTQLDVSKLSNGVYFISSFRDNKLSSVQKVVKY